MTLVKASQRSDEGGGEKKKILGEGLSENYLIPCEYSGLSEVRVSTLSGEPK
jgi:hypothetical protein